MFDEDLVALCLGPKREPEQPGARASRPRQAGQTPRVKPGGQPAPLAATWARTAAPHGAAVRRLTFARVFFSRVDRVVLQRHRVSSIFFLRRLDEDEVECGVANVHALLSVLLLYIFASPIFSCPRDLNHTTATTTPPPPQG